MRYIIIGILLFLVLSTPVFADAAPCSKPTIIVQNLDLHTDEITANQTFSLNDAFTAHLRNLNPEVEITSNKDIGNLLQHQKEKVLFVNDDNSETQFDNIASNVNAEYMVSSEIGSVGSRYYVKSSLIDVDNAIVVSRNSFEFEVDSINDLSDIIYEQAKEMGDLVTIIQDHEKKYPVPPRNPSLEVQVNPETIAAEPGKDQCTIKVQVKNCMGEPVEGTKVYFEEYTSRGIIKGEKAEDDFKYNDYQYAITDKDGFASVPYILQYSKGTKGGKDIVPIFTIGRGKKKFNTIAEIEINGIYLEAFPGKNEIAPLQETDITVSLFELDSQRQRQPLSGKSLSINKLGLSDDVRIILLGPTDEKGNPITDENGKVYLKFIAGKNERAEMLKILFKVIGTPDKDSIIAWVEINVKKDEYVATVTWKESGNWYHHITGYYGEELEMDYKFSLNSRSTWDKYSGKEKTDASFSYSDNEVINYGQDDTIDLLIKSDISGKVYQYPTVNTFVQERFNGYYIPLTNFPAIIPMSGQVTLAVGNDFECGYSAGGSINPMQAKPVTHVPITNIPSNIRPTTDDSGAWKNWLGLDELRRLKYDIDGRFSYFNDGDFVDKCQLEKSGKDIYSSQWHYGDSVYYNGPPVFFGMLAYWENMEVKGEISRDVSIKVVKN